MSEFEKWFEKNVTSDYANGLGFYNKAWLLKAWQEARKGYVSIEDLTKIMYEGMSALSGDCRVRLVLEEIKKLGSE